MVLKLWRKRYDRDFIDYYSFGLFKHFTCCESTHNDKKDVKEVILIQERLKDFVHQRCEIVLQEPSWMIDIAYSTIGVIQDYDDEWLMIVIQKSKKEIKKSHKNITN